MWIDMVDYSKVFRDLKLCQGFFLFFYIYLKGVHSELYLNT